MTTKNIRILLVGLLLSLSCVGNAYSCKISRQEALDFLYKYMPLADAYGHDREFFERNVDTSFKAREEMPWGKNVPEREFRHFVLPLSVNNEILDESRPVFYEELKERVKGMSMEEAILEINHWAHEKVTYQPSDARTSSPLSAVSQAIGRCGEESTFLVAALRAMCIPARQVYTPRWAHTDDNHAWVEAWADGKWYFLGACEPEPILNLAWFNAPASRGMLMNTNVFGDYDGPEEIILKGTNSTRINITSNYAPVGDVKVKILDKNGKPATNAKISFCIYNYAEYFTLAQKHADSKGCASLTTGIGDVVVWATDGKNFAFCKTRPGQELVLKLDNDSSTTGVTLFDIVPPRSSASLPKPTPLQVIENDIRKAYEDSIRMAYVATFITPEEARKFAEKVGCDADKLEKILPQSRGNHKMLESLLLESTPRQRERIIEILSIVNEKDRRDIPREVILDNLDVAVTSDSQFRDYILNPRIEMEPLSAWRGILSGLTTDKEKEYYRNNPEKLIDKAKELANVSEDVYNRGLPSSPLATLAAHKADVRSMNIFFVALCRATGVPARKDPVTAKTQYFKNGTWMDVSFLNNNNSSVSPKGRLVLVADDSSMPDKAKYYSNFSISRIVDGIPQLLEFDDMITLSQMLEQHPEFDAGQYILTTGQRLADGGVLVRSEIFQIKENETQVVPFIIRHDDSKLQVIGNFNSENRYFDKETTSEKSLLSSTGRGYYVLCYVKPNHEPSEHLLNEISALAKEFDSDGRKVMMLFATPDDLSRFRSERFKLPANVIIGTDIDGKIAGELAETLELDVADSPVVIIGDTFNRVIFKSSGYSIGTAQNLLNILHRLEH